MANSINSWSIDSSPINHVCNSLQGFQKTQKLTEGKVNLHLGTKALILVVAVGDVHLHFDGCRILVVNDCYYVPKFRRNLVLVSCLFEQDYLVTFNKNAIINKNNKKKKKLQKIIE